MLEERVDVVEERVDRLEAIFGQFMAQTGAALLRIDRSIERMDRAIERMERTVAEMRAEAARDRENMNNIITDMKAEAARDRGNMNNIITDMKAEAARDRENTNRMLAEIQAEGERDRRQSQRERRELARQLGDISNRMGTIVEDIIAPSLRRLAVEELGCGAERSFVVRQSKTRTDDPGRSREFDALFVGEEAVLLNETKATARPEYARDFVDFLRNGEFFLYFPEYKDRPVVPVFSSLYLPDDLVTYLTGQGIYAVAMGDGVMQVLNLEQVRTRR
jgi:hypothetical protein